MNDSLCRHCGTAIYFGHYYGRADPETDNPSVWRHQSDGYAACHTAFAEPRPRIVCLCGSTRFMDAFRTANLDFTMAGVIVLTVGCDTKSDDALMLNENDKAALDELHKRKIDLADSIFVLNVGGYIGESTRSEITYAYDHDKPIAFLEPM